MIKQVYNPLSQQEADQVEQMASDKFFPWYYFGNVHNVENGSSITYGFQHTAIDNGKENSSVCEMAKSITHSVANAAGLEIESIYHLRFNLLTKQHIDIAPHFHTDLFPYFYAQNPHLGKHYSGIYYINDSDGCTLFENEETKIEPIKNTGVVFDGTMMHSASYPMSNQIRLVLNMNFFVNE
jgi:hypothetical protein